MGRFLPSIIGAYLLACGMTSHAHAQLKPDQVVIIGMAGSEASGELARYYAKARGIPESHILLLDGKLEQRITRFRWEQTIRPAVRTWLYRQEFLPNIRCIVTVWDVPLTIAPTERSSAEFTERIGYLRRTRGALVAQACQMFDLLHSLGRPAGSATTVPPAAADISLKDLNSRFVEAMKVATERLRNASTAEDRDRASKFLERILVTVSGDHGLLQIALPRSAAAATAQTTEQKTNASYLTGRLQGLQRGIQSLEALRETVARDEQSLQLTQTMG
ncbi:MAG: hypothetical protein GX621_15175, partial [Pirellulaceae bacterium]|nr:hypothetical protein [Pirellulaceae bacterium]